MRFNLLVLVLTFLLISCSETENKRTKEKVSQSQVSSTKIDSNKYLDNLWTELVFTKGGCLTGGQIVQNGKFGGEGCIMSDKRSNKNDWDKLFSFPKNELTVFLTSKFSDTSKTNIHTCPCFVATNGEVAVYALHKINLKNWYDLKGFQTYSKKEGFGCIDNPQKWLNDILQNRKQRESLKKSWFEIINTKSQP